MKKYNMSLQRIGLGPGVLSLSIVVAILMAGSLFYESLLSLLALTMILSLITGLWALFSRSVGMVEMYVEAAPSRIHAGRTLRLTLRLHNSSRLPLIVRVRVESPYNAFYRDYGFKPNVLEEVVILRPLSTAEKLLTLEGLKRGRYLLEKIAVRISDVLGVAVASGFFTPLNEPLEMLVMPRIEVIETAYHAYRSALRLHGSGLQTRRMGYGVIFAGHRDYQPGDDARLIDWKVFARLRRLAVKMHELEEEALSLIVVDATRSMMLGPPDRSALDTSLSLALSLYEYSRSRGSRTMLGAYNEEQIWIARDPRLIPILLAEIYPAPREDLYSRYADVWEKARSDVKHIQLLRVLREAVVLNPRRMRILLITDLPVVSNPTSFRLYLENILSVLKSRRHELIMVAPVSPLFELRSLSHIDLKGAEQAIRIFSRGYLDNKRVAWSIGYPVYSMPPSMSVGSIMLKILGWLARG